MHIIEECHWADDKIHNVNTDHLSEDGISVKYITPALHKARSDEETQIRGVQRSRCL
jgi:hypothetical protein